MADRPKGFGMTAELADKVKSTKTFYKVSEIYVNNYYLYFVYRKRASTMLLWMRKHDNGWRKLLKNLSRPDSSPSRKLSTRRSRMESTSARPSTSCSLDPCERLTRAKWPSKWYVFGICMHVIVCACTSDDTVRASFSRCGFM